MLSSRSLRPSAALIVAVLALVIALGGTGYAAAKINGGSIAKGTIKGKALKAKTVTGDKVADDTLTGTEIAETTLGQVPSAATAGSASPTGSAGGDLAGTFPNPQVKSGVIGATELGTITERSSAGVTVAANATGSATIQCLAGEQVISGGNDSSSTTAGRVVASRLDPPNGWAVFMYNDSGAPITLTTRAYCLAP
jgi:hypothetical protein